MKRISSLFPFIIALVIFRNWFTAPQIVGGDWPYFFDETIRDFIFPPPPWSALHGNGIGGIIPGYFLDQYLYLTTSFSVAFQIPWVIIYKIFWFGFYIVLSIISSMYLIKTVLKAELWQMTITALIYSTNTYILMVVGGGQMGVALAYSLAPLVLAKFIKIIRDSGSKIQTSVIAGLVLAVQLMFDPRIAYITMSAVTLSLIFSIKHEELGNKIFSLLFYVLVIPIGTAILLSSYWIIPVLLAGSSPIPKGFESVSGFDFFSFADFSHALSLLHPNWPENIFGKTYFMRPEFLILPILAYSSLLFLRNLKQIGKKTILFFASLGLLGSLLAKGVNLPFGEINRLLFQYFPGMSMFRDPTKFYILVVLSYSVLIPYSVAEMYQWLKSKVNPSALPNLFLLFAFCYLLFLIRPAILGELGGTFKQHEVPQEYLNLKDFLYSQQDFFRTLWIPRQQRFTFASNFHPSVEAIPLFDATNSAQIIFQLQKPEVQRLLEELSTKYVIVPYDSLGEIFLKDRKYDEQQYFDVIAELDKISWLHKVDQFGKLRVYETLENKGHFWLDASGEVTVISSSPTHYLLKLSLDRPADLVFSETYSPYWQLRLGKEIFNPKKTGDNLNRYPLLKKGTYTVELFYTREVYYHLGKIISIITFLLVLMAVIILGKIHKKRTSS